MGVLLREVLKTLCGVDQWSYAVFWKFGCNNPKLLIWEDCHYHSPLPLTSRAENVKMPFGDGSWVGDVRTSDLGVQAGNRVRLLVDKMMVNNQVNVVGEGIVGRAAFTGKHEWIIANNYAGGAYPPEVLNEIHNQFSAGIQTIAVIPVTPHGVLQLGSSLPIMEDFGLVNNAKSLILQLGCVPGALLSTNSIAEESIGRIRMPVSFGMPVSSHLFCNTEVLNPSAKLTDSCSQRSVLSQASRFVGQPSSQILNLPKIISQSDDSHGKQKISPVVKPDNSFGGQPAEVIPSNPDAWLNQQVASYNMGSGVGHQSIDSLSAANINALAVLEQRLFSDSEAHNHLHNNMNASDNFTSPYLMAGTGVNNNSYGVSLLSGQGSHTGVSTQLTAASNPCFFPNQGRLEAANQSFNHHAEFGLQNVTPSREVDPHLSVMVNQSSADGRVPGSSDCRLRCMDVDHADNKSALKKEVDINLLRGVNTSTGPNEDMYSNKPFPGSIDDCLNRGSQIKLEEPRVQPPSGDDLYDVLGIDLKNKLLNGKWNHVLLNEAHAKIQTINKESSALVHTIDSGFAHASDSEGLLGGCMFSPTDNDHLLDAVVSQANSGIKQSSDDNMSSGTTISKISTSSIHAISPTYCQVNMSDQLQKRSFDVPKTLGKSGAIESSSFRSGSSKDDMGSCSQTTSIYGSQLTSWVGNVRHDGSGSAAFSKKKEETNKPNRKRLKPGENPRPRPKDRQMIQDRVKELREIVPNGAKCSIDALLERTIKHMIFMQSVMKHADKLKQMGDSKIINKDAGLVKDNFDGGATWAFEVGSQSMVCPIIVEDLNPPRQLLVEMLCEERGFFLEIADLVRGLGLTILKGVMEARNSKIWARFAVEADRDVTRMEIFLALVRLLEQTAKGSASSSTNALENNMMVHHAFPQVPSIPITGGTSSLL